MPSQKTLLKVAKKKKTLRQPTMRAEFSLIRARKERKRVPEVRQCSMCLAPVGFCNRVSRFCRYKFRPAPDNPYLHVPQGDSDDEMEMEEV